MVQKGIFLVLVAGSLVLSGQVMAKSCGDEANTLAIVDCHQDQYKAADKELNAVYGEAMKTLEPAVKQKFKDAQKAWLKSRDSNIAFMIEQNKDSGSYGDIVVADYKTKVVQKRVLELKYMFSGPESTPVEW